MNSDGPAPNPISYAPRQVVDCGLVRGAWTAKLYAILSGQWDAKALPSSALLAEAVRGAMGTLEAPLDHPLGFAILHLADDGTYLLLTRFNNANNLRHCVFSVGKRDGSLVLAPLDDPHIIACIWELRLMKFEADAWIDTVLQSGLTSEATERYLASRYEGTV